MAVLVTCKKQEDSIQNGGPRGTTTLYVDFRHSMADNFVASVEIRLKFKLIQAFMHVLCTCKNEEDPIKNKVARVATTFLPLYVYVFF